MADLPLMRTILVIYQKFPLSSFWEVILFCFISISKFGSFKNHFAMITSLPKLEFGHIFIILVQTKEVISMS